MLRGSQILRGKANRHNNDLYDGWLQDMSTCGIIGEIVHTCIWQEFSNDKLSAGRRLEKAGLAVMEDSQNGPMLTRTYRGSFALDHQR